LTSTAEPTKTGASGVVARNAVLRAGGEVIAKLASVVFFVAVARDLGETGFGDFMFALSFTTVLILGAGFGTEDLVAREVARERSRVHEYLSNVVALKATISVLVLLVAAAVVNFAGYSADARSAVYILGAAIAIENLGRSWHSVFQAFERMGYISFALITQRTVTAVAGVLTLTAGGGIVAVSLVYLGGAVLGFVINFLTLRRFVVRPQLSLDRSRWLPILKAGLPIGLITVLFTALLKVDQVLLSFFAGGDNREVGYYAAAFRLIEATMFVAWAFSSAVLPWLSRQGPEEGPLARGYELGMKAMAGTLLPMALTFSLFARHLIDLFYGSQYDSAVFPLVLLGSITVFYGLNSLAATALVARDRPLAFVRLVVVVAIQNIAMNAVLIPRYGADGAAVTAAVSGLVLTAAAIYVVQRMFGRLHLARAFAGPVAGGLAMAGLVVLLRAPFPVELAAGLLAYVCVALLVEWRAFPRDLALFMRLARAAATRIHPGRVRLTGGGSTPRHGRAAP
jgi:O-antigen/teichoic acid export membrane protein